MSKSGIEVAKHYLSLNSTKDRAQIMELLKSQGSDIAIDPKTIAWCSAWMNFCERSVGNKTLGKLNAKSWLTYGVEVSEEDAQEGDIVIFHWPEEPEANGHVTYFVSWDDSDNLVDCLGGNQSDSIRYSNYDQADIIGIRRAL